jgi:glycosyltransferase involved in cell wall biosynthesis
MSKKISLTIGIVSYQRELELRVLLSSLATQSEINFKVILIHDGQRAETRELIQGFTPGLPFEIEYIETAIRYNDYGHSLRQLIIDRCDTEFLLLTNDDNYYAPIFTEDMMKCISDEGLDIVLCNMVHSHVFHDLPNPFGYQVLDVQPRRWRVDIGAFIFRAQLGKKVGWRDKGFEGDATFFEDLIGQKPKPVLGKINKVLFIHN